ncbi:MAG: hypothetical protein J5792_03650 [Bacteroidales bacterium]|nr:hypothetical protein [Bacteroidales bacterium]
MKRFLVKFGITALALWMIAWGLDLLITRNLHRSDARMFSTYNAIYSDTLQCDAVVMGSSRGQVQYDVRIIDSITGLDCYNLSVDGRCIDAEVVMYNAYRQHAPKPKLIIQNIDWGTLQMSNGYEREQYLPYLDKDNLYQQTCENEGFNWADRWLPLVRYAGYRNVIFEGLGLPAKMARPDNMYKGYVAVDAEWDGSAFRAIDTLGFTCNPEAVEIFDRYLAQCQKEGIQVVLVYAPFYIGATRKMGPDVETMFALYQSFADRYGCRILNYTYDSICYDTANFYNASHLNRRGAELFSEKLANDLKELLEDKTTPCGTAD